MIHIIPGGRIMMSKRFPAAAALLILALAPAAFGNGLNLNSLGTRAGSMGGAFVGLANDFSAVYWNPAGLAFFTSRTFGFYGTDIIPSGSYKLTLATPIGNLGLVDARTAPKSHLGGLFGYVHPLGDRLVAAIGIFTPSGLGVNWQSADLANLSGGSTTIDWSSQVGMITIAPSLAFKVSDQFSIGASLNIDYATFAASTYAGSIPGLVDLGPYNENETGWGLGATFGILYKPSSRFSVGLAFRTSSKIAFSGQADINTLQYLGFSATSDMTRDMTWPSWITGGIAYRPTDKLTITADVQFTNWSVVDRITTTYKDTYWNLLMTSMGKDIMLMSWKNATQLRFGAEYKVSPSLAVRGGYYFDPSPSPENTINILLPSFDFNGLTFGLGYNAGDLNLDFGLEYLLGKERRARDSSGMLGVFNMTIVVPTVSVSYKF
jgi:long-chain fatty acid transport protein